MSHETLVNAECLAQHLDDPDWRVVDCRFDLANTRRGELDYKQAHIPGAVYAHLDRDLSAPITHLTGRHPLPTPEHFCAWLTAHGIEKGCQVVAYDDTGGTMAVRLWWLLRWIGHRNVALLDGGWQTWLEAGLATSEQVPRSPQTTWPDCAPDDSLVVDTDSLAAWVEQPDAMLVLMDARTAERFSGEAEPIDPVAGHIPGAINLPLQVNLDSDGRFKSPAVLRQLYLAALGEHSPESVVVMCGSGVTACHNLVAMEIAGLRGARLYAGSWSEWIRDSSRPVATGNEGSG